MMCSSTQSVAVAVIKEIEKLFVVRDREYLQGQADKISRTITCSK